MPAQHRGHGSWTLERLVETGRVVEVMLKAKAHPQLTYHAVLSHIVLQKKHGRGRLEKACGVASHYKNPDRRFIDNLLRHHREDQPLHLSEQR